jgi:hypothetical protein
MLKIVPHDLPWWLSQPSSWEGIFISSQRFFRRGRSQTLHSSRKTKLLSLSNDGIWLTHRGCWKLLNELENKAFQLITTVWIPTEARKWEIISFILKKLKTHSVTQWVDDVDDLNSNWKFYVLTTFALKWNDTRKYNSSLELLRERLEVKQLFI